jgi:tetratricopeptide (TPR) repeat protein
LPGLQKDAAPLEERDRIMAQNQLPDLFVAASHAAERVLTMPHILAIGGGVLFAMIGVLGAARLWRAVGTPARKQRGGFSLQKGGPVAAHYERGNAFIRNGDIDRAIESFSKALRLNPDFAGVLIGRGAALYKKGDYENAIADLSEALYLDPKSAKAYYYRGIVLGMQGNYAGAVDDYDRSLRLQPGQKKVRDARELAMAKIDKAAG